MTRRAVWRIAGLTLLLTAEVALAESYKLSITGDDGASYQGACTVTSATGDDRVDLAGEVPHEQAFEATGLACRFETEGRVVVEVTHANSRSRSSTNGGVVNITVR